MMKKTEILFCILFIMIYLFSTSTILYAQDKAAPSCVSTGCHEKFGKAKFVHGPIAVKDCISCHELLPNETHKFKQIKKIDQLCYNCHDPMNNKAVVHSPVTKGQCTVCHDPHQSDFRYQLKKEPVAELCFSCHNRDIMSKKFKHGPAAEGDCTVCHSPHSSDNTKLLLLQGNALCFECHTDIKDSFAQAKYVHKPASELCIKCHSPHSNDSKYMLPKDVPDLCYSCHKDVETHIAKVTVKHGAMGIDNKCLNCHSPHEAQYPKQLKDEPMTLCLSCHDKPVTATDGSTLINMKDWLAQNKDWHGPIRERDCSGCHDPHGSDNFRILKKYYPKEFYASFSQYQYDLCFSCHQPTLVLDAKTTTLTGFRDGDRNLHYLHVNRTKGRTCRACHETHASQEPKHIREAVPFGKWTLPIHFEKTSDGGRCAPGCHSPKQYSRTLSAPVKK